MQPLLEIIDLRVDFPTETGLASVVDGVSLAVPSAKVVALVGESGCGKSLTALSILRLIPQPGAITDGHILWHGERHSEMESIAIPRDSSFLTHSPNCQITKSRNPLPLPHGRGSDGVDLMQLNERDMRRIRGNRIAMIFQEPMTALNPVFSIGEQIVEAIELHQNVSGKSAWLKAIELLRRVGIAAPDRRIHDYPHQFSGGMRQRAMIAMALACRPALLIADEPTTALDVTIQAQILDLLRGLQAETGMSVLFITHDLGVVAEIADEVYVMYAGRIVERGPTRELFAKPCHPYTRGLLRCTPRMEERRERLEVIAGSPPDPARFPSGCRFHPRCALSAEQSGATWRHSIEIESDINKKVLRRCVESFEGEPSGRPLPREVSVDHHVACWEVG